MPASKDGDVQTDRTDGRKFITLRVNGNGTTAYRKIYLRTFDHRLARRRARALESILDPREARRVIEYLASARTPGQERDRLAELTDTAPLVSSLSHQDARKELEDIVCLFGDCSPGELDDEIVDRWRSSTSANDQRKILIELSVPEDYLSDNPDIFTSFKVRGRKVNPRYNHKADALRALFGLPFEPAESKSPARGPRLSACVSEFEAEQKQLGRQKKHTNTYINRFRDFVEFTNDKTVSRLEKADFAGFVDRVVAGTQGRSNKTIRDHLRPVGAVLECARARMEDGAFPETLDNWLKVLDRAMRQRAYKSPRSNREPIPPGTFQGLIAVANEWAELDWNAYAESLPVPACDNNRRKALARTSNRGIAWTRKRTGLISHSMLCLAANVGAQPIDFARLLWDELDLDGEMPLYKEDRSKPAHLLGSDVPRRCPLLPATIRSLLRWRQSWIAEQSDREQPMLRYVFTNVYGKPLNQERSFTATRYLGQIRRAANCKNWEVRHCRNIGSTLVRDNHLPEAMSAAWLGHSAGGTNKFYTGGATDSYLLPLVEAIGERYFGER